MKRVVVPPLGGPLVKGGIRVGTRATRCCAALFLLLASVGAQADWPTYHGAPDLRGVSSVALPETLAPVWRTEVGGEVDQPPVSDGERIFVAARKGRVVALSLTGALLWERSFTRTTEGGQELPLRLEAPLAVFEGVVLAGSTRGVLYALDAQTGKTLWSYDTDGVILGSPNLVNAQTVVVIDQTSGALHALELTSGALLWQSEGLERCDGSPGVGDGSIVFGSCAAELHLFSLAGTRVTNVCVGGESQLAGGSAIAEGRVYAGTRDGGLICGEVRTGELIWRFDEADDQAFGTPAVGADSVVFTADDGGVYAVRRGWGSRRAACDTAERGRRDASGTAELGRQDAGGTVELGRRDAGGMAEQSRQDASDTEAGSLIWKYDTGGLPTSPVIVGRHVAVSVDGELVLLSRQDGKKVWSQLVSDEITSPSVIGELLVVGADDGTVAAFGARLNHE